MELRHLRYFVAVAEELNFCRAAERLHIAQPPLSLQIRHLEEELHTALFDRVKRRLVLTAAGQSMLEDARRLLGDAEKAKHRARAAARGQTGRLAIGYVGTAIYDLLPDAVRLFRQRHASVELSLEDMSSAAQVQALRRGQIQLGILRPPINDDTIETEDFVQERLMVALPERHALSGHSHVRLTDLMKESFVQCAASVEPSLHRCYLDLLKRASFEPCVLQEVTHLQTQLGLVAAGMGVSLVPSGVMNLPRPGVVYREVSGPQVMLPKSVAWMKGISSPQLEGFLSAIRQTASRQHESTLSVVPKASLSA